jgi:hypothetical protein
MAYTELTSVQEEEVRRDIAGGRVARHQGLLTAIDDQTLAGDTYALADEGAVIINNRSRIEEIEQLLVDLGLLSAMST